MALLLTPIFGPTEAWQSAFAIAMPELDVRMWPEVGNVDEIDIAAFGPPD
jgi:hypothetical protein